MSIYRGAGGSGDATNDATVSQVQTYASQAATSATNAASSATAAAGNASTAATQASLATSAKNDSQANATTVAGYVASALASQTAASGSATAAATSATAAALSAGDASGSASSASSSASTATTQATAASTSATNSANSAASALAIYGNTTAMNTAVTNASNSATSASTSASNASTSASNAATSASNALASETSAANSATTATTQVGAAVAIYGDITAVQNAATNSTANKNAAAASASAASASASAASTSATNSSNSASAAATSAAAASAVALGNEPVRHSVRPSLLLDFANTKQLDPRITFTRASTATFYDGRTTAKAEENLFTFSEQFDDAAWNKVAQGTAIAPTITANYAASPDGISTAERAQFSLNSGTTTSDISRITQTKTITSGITASYSIWIRSTDGVSSYEMQIISPTGAGIPITVTGTWTRFNVTAVSGGAVGYGLRLRGSSTPTNSNTADVLIWGAQLEERSSVTAYTPTTTAAITNYIPALQTAASGVARFDHNPTTGESLGLLIEEQRVNLLTRSEEFDNAAWSKTNSTISANTIIAPDGTLTGDKLVETATTNAHVISIGGATNGVTYTFSVYAKAAERTQVALQTSNVTVAYFNLSSGTVISGANASIQSVGNGWYRCSVTTTYGANGSSFIYTAAASSVTTTGNGWSGVYIWGAQLEAGAFATSYIPTVASQVTRSPDAASMTGTNFSSWYRTDEGTMYGEASSYTVSGTPSVCGISDGTNSNRTLELNLYTSARLINVNQGTNDVAITFASSGAGLFTKMAGSAKLNDFAFSVNGATATTDTSAVIPKTVNGLAIGTYLYNSNVSTLNGSIKKLAYYPKKLTNAELSGLTTV